MTLSLNTDVFFLSCQSSSPTKPAPLRKCPTRDRVCRAEPLLAGATCGTPTGPKTLQHCRWSVGEETSCSIQVKVMYFVVVVIWKDKTNKETSKKQKKNKTHQHVALCRGTSDTPRWRSRCQVSGSRTHSAAATAVRRLPLLLVVLSRVWTLADQSKGWTGFVFIAQRAGGKTKQKLKQNLSGFDEIIAAYVPGQPVVEV